MGFGSVKLLKVMAFIFLSALFKKYEPDDEKSAKAH